jgi:hypothetical protein
MSIAKAFLYAMLFSHVLTWGQVSRDLVGKYQMEMQTSETMELRADGSASMGGEETSWAVRGNQLTVGTDVMPFLFQGGRLIMTVGPIQLAWRKVGGTPGKSIPAAKAPKDPSTMAAPGGSPQDAQHRQILMNNAWCSFTFNKNSGTSTTRRVVFRPDGLLSVNGGAESYSSGQGGTYAGQSSTANAMRWRYENLRLYVDDGSGTGFQDVGLTATQNSGGSPILHAAGLEYAVCR